MRLCCLSPIAASTNSKFDDSLIPALVNGVAEASQIALPSPCFTRTTTVWSCAPCKGTPELRDHCALGASVILGAARVIADGVSALNSLQGVCGAPLNSE